MKGRECGFMIKAKLKASLQKALQRPESDLEPEAMESLGINNIMCAAKMYNRRHYGTFQKQREAALRNGASTSLPQSSIEIRDGWALDQSGTLPHLDRLLAEADEVIEERAGSLERVQRRGFMRDLLQPNDLERFPSFLDFILSDEVLAPVCQYLGYAPVLSDLVPPGVRFAESNQALDPKPSPVPRQSQLYHLDFHDMPLIYVIVLLRDVTPESGPFTFLGDADSQKAAKALRYGKRGRPFRISDEEMYSVVDKSAAHEMIYPRGTVLFIDSSRCFHFGSRHPVVPRYQMMYAYVSACRTDFSEKFLPRRKYPIKETDSRLRRFALDREYSGA
jgi:hypothetical protein